MFGKTHQKSSKKTFINIQVLNYRENVFFVSKNLNKKRPLKTNVLNH